MRETNFIDQNKKKWQEFETMLHVKDKDPDKLSELFVQITDDLSYAKTFYPNRSVRFYLNNLGQQVFYNIYKGKKNGFKNFKQFWVHDLPKVLFESRKELTTSFIIFSIAILIGIFSNIHDPEFPKYILGKAYVEMTKENIKSGDPMAIYKSANQFDMFLEISANNIYVAFKTFIFGVFFAVGSIASLLSNGVMVGTFQYFFIERGLFWESFLTIWLHGTLEISSIIIAGGAGLKLGSGLVFPGSYSRIQAFKISAKKGLMIMLGITPIFLFAAIIESFVTRYTDAPDILKGALILVSFIFIVGYFIFLPLFKARKNQFTFEEEKVPATKEIIIDYSTIKNNGEIFTDIFVIYKKLLSKILPFSLICAILYTLLTTFVLNKSLPEVLHTTEWTLDLKILQLNYFIIKLFDYSSSDQAYLFLLNCISISAIISYTSILFKKQLPNSHSIDKPSILKIIFQSTFISFVINLFFYSDAFFTLLLLMLVLPIINILLVTLILQSKTSGNIWKTFTSLVSQGYGKLIGINFISFFSSFIYYSLFACPLTLMYFEIINWNLQFDESQIRVAYIAYYTFISFIALQMILPIFLIGYGLSYFSIRETKEALKLKERIMNFGAKAKNVYSK